MKIAKIGAKEFKERVIAKLKQIDANIKDDDLYFTQTKDSYHIAYMPEYPNNNNADFVVYQDLAGNISLSGNLYSLIPTIRRFTDINDFEENL